MRDQIDLNGTDCVTLETEGSTAMVCREADGSYFTAKCEPGKKGGMQTSIGIDKLDLSLVEISGEAEIEGGCQFEIHHNSSPP